MKCALASHFTKNRRRHLSPCHAAPSPRRTFAQPLCGACAGQPPRGGPGRGARAGVPARAFLRTPRGAPMLWLASGPGQTWGTCPLPLPSSHSRVRPAHPEPPRCPTAARAGGSDTAKCTLTSERRDRFLKLRVVSASDSRECCRRGGRTRSPASGAWQRTCRSPHSAQASGSAGVSPRPQPRGDGRTAVGPSSQEQPGLLTFLPCSLPQFPLLATPIVTVSISTSCSEDRMS